MAEMVKHEWKIGDVTITVEAPYGVDMDRVSASVRSADRAEFLRAVEAVGGLEGMSFPRTWQPYAQSAIAYPRRDDGTLNTTGYVSLGEPLDQQGKRVKPTDPPHPFFAQLADRHDREQSPTASSPETGAKGPGPVPTGQESRPMSYGSGSGAEPSEENPGGKP